LPLLNAPSLNSSMTSLTVSCAFFPYRAIRSSFYRPLKQPRVRSSSEIRFCLRAASPSYRTPSALAEPTSNLLSRGGRHPEEVAAYGIQHRSSFSGCHLRPQQLLHILWVGSPGKSSPVGIRLCYR
jgi:hypothetical protein